MKLTRTLVVLLAFGMVSAFAAPGYAENGAETAVTYYKDVLPIMQENCQKRSTASSCAKVVGLPRLASNRCTVFD